MNKYKLYFSLLFVFFLIINTELFAYFPSPSDWRDQTFYMVMIDRFQNGDTTNDNHNGNYLPSNWSEVHGGDLKGIIQKLDYLKTLGVTGLWISPVPTNDGNYHGYAATNWKQVDPRIGTMTDLQNLITQAHVRGIYVFLDIVCNHNGRWISQPSTTWSYPTGYTLSWFNTSKKYSPSPFDNLSSFHNYGNIANFNDTTQLVLGWLNGLSDIKTEDTTIRNALIDIYKWWIQQTDCDGFRIDTFKHIAIPFWQVFCSAIRNYAASLGKSNFLMYGEDLDSNDSSVGSYTGTKAGGGYVMPSMLYYPMYYTINNVFSSNQDTKQIDDRYANLTDYDTTTWDYLATFIDNHDQTRFLAPSKANRSTNKLKLALFFLLTTRGIPIIYYGTEQGFYGEDDPYCREDMFAGLCKDTAFMGQDSFITSSTLFQFTSTLIYLRNNYEPLRRGSYTSRWYNSSSAGIYAFSRILNGKEIIVVLNTASSTQTTQNGNNGITTTYPQYTVLTNLLNSTDTVVVGTAGLLDTSDISVVMPAQSMKILSGYSIATNPPSISSTIPFNSQSNVTVSQQISVTFSTPMNEASVESVFSTNPTTTGTFLWNNQTLLYTPSTTLSGNQLYIVSIGSTAFSPNTKNLSPPYSFTFTTSPGTGISDFWKY